MHCKKHFLFAVDIITFYVFYLNPFLQRNNQPAANRYFINNFSYNYIALYNLGGITMHRAISNYKITKRKDGRYYVRLQDRVRSRTFMLELFG